MPTGPTSLVHWLGGYDLAGVGALTEIADVTEGEFRGVTPLGPEGAIEHEAPLGRIKYALTESGHLRENQRSLRRLLAGRTEGHPSVVGHFGGAVGAACVLATNMRIKKSSIPPDMNDFTKVAFEYACERPCDIFDDSKLVAGGARVTGAAPAAPYAGYRLDGGAASAAGAVVCVMLDGIVWRSATSLTVAVRHSATPTVAGWSTLANGTLAVDSPGDVDDRVLLLVHSGNLERYMAVTWSWGAQSEFRIDLGGGYAAGATDIHLDGRTPVESLVAGDQFRIGTAALVHTVTSGGIVPGAAGTEFDVEFTPPTAAQANNNVTVTTVAAADQSAKILAAIERQ